MKMKPAKVLLFYYLFLGASSLLFSWLNIHPFTYLYAGRPMEFNPIIIPTIIGGIISLGLTIPTRSLRIFLIVYTFLWVFRFVVLYIANHIGEAYIFHRVYRVDLIVGNYYKTVSRLDTHLPFVIYWFINYIYTTLQKKKPASEAGEQPEKKQQEPEGPAA